MEYEKIKQLIEDMGNSKLTSVDIEFPDGIKIKMEKKTEIQFVSNNGNFNDNKEIISTQTVVPVQTSNMVNNSEILSNTNSNVTDNDVIQGELVKSPMIGTFYSKPSPTSNPYVEIGTEVKKGDVLCIIEAMKLMNEIEAETSGKIAEILVKEGEAVDYGKPLFKIV